MQNIEKLNLVFIVIVNMLTFGIISHVMNHFFAIMGLILLSLIFSFPFSLNFWPCSPLSNIQFVVVLSFDFANSERVHCYPFFWACKNVLLFFLILSLKIYHGKIGWSYDSWECWWCWWGFLWVEWEFDNQLIGCWEHPLTMWQWLCIKWWVTSCTYCN